MGLAGVYKGDGGVEFRVDPGSIFNADTNKGYEYTEKPPERLKSSLDAYQMADSDKDKFGNWYVHKKLKDHWYLYFFVDR